MNEEIAAILDRDLGRVEEEVRLYPGDGAIWATGQGISNPAGTLVLHIVGNLEHYIGALLGGTGYVRDREREFSARGVSREEMLEALDGVRETVRRVVPSLPPERLEEVFPEGPFEGVTTRFFLLHLASHLGYHLGQINYHRRLLPRRKDSAFD